MVFVDGIYDNMVVDTRFNKFHGRPFARALYLYVFLMKEKLVGDSPRCYQGQQDDFTRTMLSITILSTDTI